MKTPTSTSQSTRKRNDFANAKRQCLEKVDKSSAGRWDLGAIEICELINSMEPCYTTSSCAGRCFLYQGQGVKSTDTFRRFRVSHESIVDARRYFDLATIQSDPTGGGDELSGPCSPPPLLEEKTTVWLRYEPFILHVACRSLTAAHHLMEAARPTFKNVGLTTWNKQRYLVAIWGDEGLEMPITDQNGTSMFDSEWLKDLVQQRHTRNREKVQRFAATVRALDVESMEEHMEDNDVTPSSKNYRSYDVVGDVALFHNEDLNLDQAESILRQNKAIKVVAVRNSNLNGSERAPGKLRIVAGPERRPLMTTHKEYGIQCVVDLERTFFSVRMNRERQRICQLVQEGETVLVLFCGVGMDALQIACRTKARKITAIESNDVAVACALKSILRNKGLMENGHLEVIEGNVLEVLPSLPLYDRILAPRPKEGAIDGQQPDDTTETLAGGSTFLAAALSRLNPDGGTCHWYDFCADFEFPKVPRTRRLIQTEAIKAGLDVDIINVAKAGSVAMRQLRVCVDFRVSR